ncbi:hypothetical protein X943_000621 [Babesia divergens]|uniref:Uncharacterized protein n=1 Tax=Babesia divergens TaxID=32595 RepID=A0AAD9G6K2_BABDI|nr:hypothetical protein X943_000621 [Babesia divergens]
MLITDEMHARMSNICQAVFDWSFAFLVLPLSALAYFLKRVTDKTDLFILSTVMGIAFAFLSLLSLYNYHFGMQDPIPMNRFLSNEIVELSVASVVEEIFNKLDDVKEGMFIACSQRYLMKSVFFLSMETAFEHSIAFFIIPIIALTTPFSSEATMLTSNLFCVILISIGKIGGSIYYLYVTHTGIDGIGSATRLHRTSNDVQKCLVMSCVSLLLLPFSLYLDTTFPSLSSYRLVIMSLGIFLFFAFSAYPKSILALSMHATILSHPLSYKIFDFVGLFITFLDTLLVLGLSFFMNKIEGKYTVEAATFSIALFYVLHSIHQLGTGCNNITIDSSRMQSQGLIWPPAY